MGALWFVIDAVGKRLQRVHCRPFAAPVLIRSRTYPAPAPFQAAATRVCTPLGFSDLNYPASGKSRKGQEMPGEARRGQERPGEARRSQERPGDAPEANSNQQVAPRTATEPIFNSKSHGASARRMPEARI